jgi:RHS repeat-associated protein
MRLSRVRKSPTRIPVRTIRPTVDLLEERNAPGKAVELFDAAWWLPQLLNLGAVTQALSVTNSPLRGSLKDPWAAARLQAATEGRRLTSPYNPQPDFPGQVQKSRAGQEAVLFSRESVTTNGNSESGALLLGALDLGLPDLFSDRQAQEFTTYSSFPGVSATGINESPSLPSSPAESAARLSIPETFPINLNEQQNHGALDRGLAGLAPGSLGESSTKTKRGKTPDHPSKSSGSSGEDCGCHSGGGGVGQLSGGGGGIGGGGGGGEGGGGFDPNGSTQAEDPHDIEICFPSDLEENEWEVEEYGGSELGKGGVRAGANNTWELFEGDSLYVALKHTFPVPTNPGELTFTYQSVTLDSDAQGQIKDAFEVALVDDQGRPLAYPYDRPRDATYNYTEAPVGKVMYQTTYETSVLGGTVVHVDLSQMSAGQEFTFLVRLVSNDDDHDSVVVLPQCGGNENPAVDVKLKNDTAPAGYSGDVYNKDKLTNDPTVTGNYFDEQGVVALHAQVDSDPNWIDITSSMLNGTYTWNPGTLSYGSHTIKVRATDTQSATTTATLNFTVNTPPTAHAGGNATINEGATRNFSGSSSSDPNGIYGYTWTFPDESTASGVTAPYTFFQDGTYQVQLDVEDTAGSIDADTATITVNNVAPTNFILDSVTGNEGQLVTLTGSFDDPGLLDEHVVTIVWGDGTTGEALVSHVSGSNWSVRASHYFPDNKTYQINGTVDDGPAVDTDDTTAVISNVAPSLTSKNLTVNQGQEFTLPLAWFTDPGFTPPNNEDTTVETFTATITWQTGGTPQSVTPSVVNGDRGRLTTGTVTGTHTYNDVGDYTVTVKVTDDNGGEGTTTFTISVGGTSAKFYVVDQREQHEALYRYGSNGTFLFNGDLHNNNNAPQGIAANSQGTRLWVVDSRKDVFVYDGFGTEIGRWHAQGTNQPQDIATDGTDIWIVDGASRKILYYANAALLEGEPGTIKATAAMDLWGGKSGPAKHDKPTGLVYRDYKLWVTDLRSNGGGQRDAVYVYEFTKNGANSTIGQPYVWYLDAQNTNPRGITLNPGNSNDKNLWVIDKDEKKVFVYSQGVDYTANSTHSADSTFDLVDDQDENRNIFPEGIADPPVLTVATPEDEDRLPIGTPVVISGQVDLAQLPAGFHVALNGRAVDTIDASGRFFSRQVLAQGDNVFTIDVTNANGTTVYDSQTVKVTGKTTLPGQIDLDLYTDVTPSFEIGYGRTSFDNGDSQRILYTNVTVTNDADFSNRAIDTPLLLTTRFVDVPSIRLRGTTGNLPDGRGYYDLTGTVSGNPLPVGGTATATVGFYDPTRVHFDHEFQLYAPANHNPFFTSVPVIRARTGSTYSYSLAAFDRDGDALTFTVLAGPSGLNIDTENNAIWTPFSSGVYPVRLKVTDGRGGSAIQPYVILVEGTPAFNGPPYFITEPVTEGYVGVEYVYPSEAADPDEDELVYSLVTGEFPEGMTVDDETGEITWTPTYEQLGLHHVVVKATEVDSEGLYTTQAYDILVRPTPGNRPPAFDSIAPTHVPVTVTYVYDSNAIDPDNDVLTYTLVDGKYPEEMTMDPGTGVVTWPTDQSDVATSPHTVWIRADDGRGGFDIQIFDVTVVDADPGSIAGTVFNDIDEDGGRDGLPIPPPPSSEEFTLVEQPTAEQYDRVLYHPIAHKLLMVRETRPTVTLEFLEPLQSGQTEPDATFFVEIPRQLVQETYPTIVPDGNRAGFQPGDVYLAVYDQEVFVGGGTNATPSGNVIAKVTHDGQIDPDWVEFPIGWRVGALTVDKTGVWGDLLLARVNSNTGGQIWSITPEGHKTLLIDDVPLSDDGDFITVPDDPAFGLLQGAIVAMEERNTGYYVKKNPQTGEPEATLFPEIPGTFSLVGAEGLDVIPRYASNMFALADPAGSQQAYLYSIPGYQFLGGSGNPAEYGKILVSFEFPHDRQSIAPYFIALLSNDGEDFTLEPLTYDDPQEDGLRNWEQLRFIPADPWGDYIPPEPPLPHWTVYLDLNSNGKLERGEPFQVVGEDGAYKFDNLAPGTYTVAEIPNPGWEQTAPTPIPPGTHTVTIVDPTPLHHTGKDFGNRRLPPGNSPPEIVSEPPDTVFARATYRYDVVARDPENDRLAYDLPVAPDGMVVDPTYGVLLWRPTIDQVGTHQVLLRVKDPHGEVDLQFFSVTVEMPNRPPVITSVPPGVTPDNPKAKAFQGRTWTYTLQGTDPDGDIVTYYLEDISGPGNPDPQNYQPDETTGQIEWVFPAGPNTIDTYSITLRVEDDRGGFTFQTFQLEAYEDGPNHSPEILSNPRLRTRTGVPYYYQIVAIDEDFDPLSYVLEMQDSSPLPDGMIYDSQTGLVTWPAEDVALGDYDLRVRVLDDAPSEDEQEFTLVVRTTTENHAPRITSTPPQTGAVDKEYRYDVTATDEDGDPLVFLLTETPRGMVIDEQSGQVRWTPDVDQVGEFLVEVTVLDGLGGSTWQPFFVNVRGANRPPKITSEPRLDGRTNIPYGYQVLAEDPDGDRLHFAEIDLPNYLTIDPDTGVISGTPTQETDADGDTVEVRVYDDYGGETTQRYQLHVDDGINRPPVITSEPIQRWEAGEPYEYQVEAYDPDDDDIDWDWSSSPPIFFDPPTISSDGLFEWTNPLNGTYLITITAADPINSNLWSKQIYSLQITTNLAPVFDNGPPDEELTAGLVFRWDVLAHDPNASTGDTITYSLQNHPSGMTIDQEGRIRWVTPTMHHSASDVVEEFTIVITDDRNLASTQAATVTLTADDSPPDVELHGVQEDDVVSIDTEMELFVFATDDVGVTSKTLTITDPGTSAGSGDDVEYAIELDAAGRGFFTPAVPRVLAYTATALAEDASEQSTTVAISFFVNDPSVDAPVVTLEEITESGEVTTLTPIQGTVDVDPGLESETEWTVTIRSADGGDAIQIGEGTGEVTNPENLGVVLDPSILENGSYVVTLRAVNSGGTASASRSIRVTGHLKLGNFNMSVTDLTVPVAGIPISVGRTYDTLRAGRDASLGFGWTLNIGDADLRVDLVDGAGTGWGGYPRFLEGTRVFVTFPGGERQGFTFHGELVNDFFKIYQPTFIPDAGNVYFLTVPFTEYLSKTDEDEFYAITLGGLRSYNPEDPFFGGVYDLFEPNGIQHEVSASTGRLLHVQDRNGNRLTYDFDGITSNREKAPGVPLEVQFERDPTGEHITAVKDPRGNYVRYGYDSQGNLVTVKDRLNRTTTYEYLDGTTGPKHYLTSIIDPAGRKTEVAYSTESEDLNRLKSLKDPTGATATFVYDMSNPDAVEQAAIDPESGEATTLVYDSNGNIKGTVTPTGETTTIAYESGSLKARNAPTTVTQIVGQPGGSDDLVTTIVYDNRGFVQESTDPEGKTSYFTFDDYGNPLTASDPIGGTVRNAYDERGNLTYTTRPLTSPTQFFYDEHGNLTQSRVQDSLGTTETDFTYDTLGRRKSTTVHKPTGDVTTTTTYDDNGNLTTSVYNSENNGSTVRVTTTYDYDTADRPLMTHTPDGTATAVSYDPYTDLVAFNYDTFGKVTATHYDARGLVVETISSTGVVSRTYYDKNGRVQWQTDAYVPGDDIVPGTKTVYDDAGRVINTIRYQHIAIGVEYHPDSRSYIATAPTGQLDELSRTTTVYDAVGRVEEAIVPNGTAAGLSTQYTYDKRGLTRSITQHADDGTNTFDITTTTVYDNAGRAIVGIDAEGIRTTTIYDDAGRVRKTMFADNTFVEMTYDQRGRKTTDKDQLSQVTSYAYDEHGRLTSVTQPKVDPGNGMPVSPVTQYEYDRWGNLTQIKDALFGQDDDRVTTFTYDHLGRQKTRVLPGGATETWTYATAAETGIPIPGLLKEHVDFEGQIEQPRYDEFGRVTSREWLIGAAVQERVEYRYDDLGRLDQEKVVKRNAIILSPAEITEYAFDEEGRTIEIVSPEGTLRYEYDDATGWHTRTLASYNESLSGDLSYEYDVFGRLSKITTTMRGGQTPDEPEETTYTYRDTGVIDEVFTTAYGANVEGRKTKYTYDALWRPIREEHIWVLDDDSEEPMAIYEYARRADGKVKRVLENERSGVDDLLAVSVADYQYDALGRLTQEVSKYPGTGPLAGAITSTLVYDYDLVGNRTHLSRDVIGLGVPTIDETITYTYDARDRLQTEVSNVNDITTYTYNDNGDLIAQESEDREATYTYNQRGRMTGAVVTEDSTTTTLTYVYNESGIRTRIIENGTPKSLLVDAMNPTGYAQVVEERVLSQLVAAYVYGLEPLLQMQIGENGWEISSYASDLHSGTRFLLDDTGALARELYRYDAFGKQQSNGHTSVNPLLYRGEYFDSPLEQYYLRSRYYNTSVARFNAMDGVKEVVSSPARSHKYAYSLNDGVNLRDPNGYFPLAAPVIFTSAGRGLSAATAINVGFGLATLAANCIITGQAILSMLSNGWRGFVPSGICASFQFSASASGFLGGYSCGAYVDFKTGKVFLYPAVDFGLSPLSRVRNGAYSGFGTSLSIGGAFNVTNPSDLAGDSLTAVWPLPILYRNVMHNGIVGLTKMFGLEGMFQFLAQLSRYQKQINDCLGAGGTQSRQGTLSFTEAIGSDAVQIMGGWRSYGFAAYYSYAWGPLEVLDFAKMFGRNQNKANALMNNVPRNPAALSNEFINKLADFLA